MNAQRARNSSRLNFQFEKIHSQATHEEQPETSDPSEQSESCEEQPESPDWGEQSESYEEQPQTPGRSEQSESQPPSPIQPGKHTCTDNFQLRIPLMQYPSGTTETLETPTKEILPADTIKPYLEESSIESSLQEEISPGTTETLETLTKEILPADTIIPYLEESSIESSLQEEISPGTTETLETLTKEILPADTIKPYLEESSIQPFLQEEISSELIKKIIEELRAEPELRDTFLEIEEQLQFEQLAMDIEIPEYDLLEKELENW